MNRSLLFLFALLASSVFVAGCGGGGHSSAGSSQSRGTGVLSVTLNGDAGTADGPTGTTQTVVIYRNDGAEVDKQTVNLSSGTKQLNFTGIPAGTMHLHVGLSATTGGAEIGAVDTTFAGGTAATPVIVEMKQPVTGAVLSTSSGTVNVGANTPLYAAAQAGDGSYVFTASSGWSWSSDSTANATVSTAGVVTGVAVGNANVTAKHVASGASAACAMTVLTSSVYQGKWTVMVYMDAANSLYPYAPDNINQMERIANNPNVRFVIQWKQVQGLEGNTNPLFSGTRRYLATYDTTGTIASTMVDNLGSGVDMASPAALRDFVTWTKSKYPADHYALVLWSHGGGWYSDKAVTLGPKKRAIIYDDDSGNYLDLPDVRGALDSGSLDILAYDACLMQGAESLLEFSDRTKVIVGTEDDTPGPGYPYHLMFKPIVDAPDTTATALATSMVSTFVNYYKDDSADGVDWPIQMSALDTSKASAVASALDGLGSALLNVGSAGGTAVQKTVRPACVRIQPAAGYFYYDLDQLATTFATQTSLGTGVQTAASTLDTAIQSAVIATAGGEGVTAAPAYHGMSIDFSPSSVIDDADSGYSGSYNKLLLSSLTHWGQFIENTTVNP